MITELIRAKTLPEAHAKALKTLWQHGKVVDAPDWDTKRKEIMLIQHVTDVMQEPIITSAMPCGGFELLEYCREVVDGIKDENVDNGKWVYTYHDRMVRPHNQINAVVEELIRNPNSTRACIVLRRPEESNDAPCLSFIQFMIRDNKLNIVAMFRSNEALRASPMNDVALVFLATDIAFKLNLQTHFKLHFKVGAYTKIADSYHVYERDFDMLEAYACKEIPGIDSTDFFLGNYA